MNFHELFGMNHSDGEIKKEAKRIKGYKKIVIDFSSKKRKEEKMENDWETEDKERRFAETLKRKVVV